MGKIKPKTLFERQTVFGSLPKCPPAARAGPWHRQEAEHNPAVPLG